MKAFVPEAGDFVWLTFDPQAGRELAGRRPALVLSPKAYNERSAWRWPAPSRTRPRDTRSKWPSLPVGAQPG